VDPVSGKGMGVAPIGHIVTVATVEMKSIPIGLKIRLASGYDSENVKPYIESTIKEYFDGLNDGWEDLYSGEDDDGIVVMVSYLAGCIQMLAGIKGIGEINVGGAFFGQELQLGRDCLAQLGELSVEVID
jgi:uncharacterized phage protein gp47/JayE